MFSLVDSLKIQIGTLQPIDFVHEVKMVSTWKKFTDTCTITLPRKIRVLQAGAVKELPDLLSVGDPVSVAYGYDGQLREEFTGYISAIKPGTPFSIECEDAMWLLKRKQLSKAWRTVTLEQLLKYVLAENGLADVPVLELGTLSLGKYTISKATGAQVFDALKKQFGISCFFRRGTLVAGDPYQAHGKPAEHKYEFSGPAGNIISPDLAYTLADDVALRFHGISYLKGGKKIEVEEGGSTKTGKVKGETGQVVNAFSKGRAGRRTTHHQRRGPERDGAPRLREIGGRPAALRWLPGRLHLVWRAGRRARRCSRAHRPGLSGARRRLLH